MVFKFVCKINKNQWMGHARSHKHSAANALQKPFAFSIGWRRVVMEQRRAPARARENTTAVHSVPWFWYRIEWKPRDGSKEKSFTFINIINTIATGHGVTGWWRACVWVCSLAEKHRELSSERAKRNVVHSNDVSTVIERSELSMERSMRYHRNAMPGIFVILWKYCAFDDSLNTRIHQIQNNWQFNCSLGNRWWD